MKTLRYNYRTVLLSFMLCITGTITHAYGQTIQIEAQPSESSLVAGQQVELTFSISEPADAYFFSAEVEFDPEVFEYTGITLTDLTDGGLQTAALVSPNMIGAAVSRTIGLEAPASGDLMILTFTVKTFSPAGTSSIEFDNVKFADSNGEPIDFDPPEDVELTIEESISSFSLDTPLSITVTEGDSYQATGKLFANGITTDEENSSRVNMWVGVSETNSDPSGWGDPAWELMSFEDQTGDDFFEYLGEIAFQRDVGSYYVALRADLDDSGEFSYAGVGGFWNVTENLSAQLEIQEQDQYQYVVAEWTFSNELYTPDRATFPNQTTELELSGASLHGFVGGAANSRGWNTFGEQENYWQIIINTEDLENLKLSSDQSGGSNTGPRDFKVQYSLDGTSWTDFAGGDIKVGDSEKEVIEQMPFPSELENQSEVYIRWVQNSDVRVDGDTLLNISSGGTSRIDDILITGQATTPTRVDVWPGDANEDGKVNETDVLAIATYWLTEGPSAIYPGITWAPREVEEWIPAAATAADTDGSGRVDQNDLQAIGLNFDKSTDEEPSVQRQLPPIAELQIDPLKSGDTMAVFLVADNPVELSGLSFRLDMNGLKTSDWKISDIKPLDWAADWQETNRLIEFRTAQDDFWAAAMAHKGSVEPNETMNLAMITLEAIRDWEEPTIVRLLKASASSRGETTALSGLRLTEDLAVSLEPPVTERPERTQLLPNYPNPFNPATTIPYTLSEPGDVQIEIFDAIGRRVALFQRQAQQAGEHTLKFDASKLSSGLYLYRFQSNGVVQTRKMLLLK